MKGFVMKKKILFLSVVFTVCLLNTGLLSANNTDVPDKNKDVELTGNLLEPGTRSLLPPISAIQYSNYIEVSLSRFLGEISVSIYDEANNVVYTETINPATQPVFCIDTGFLCAGVYSIEFVNSQGQYLEGSFVIE